MTTRCPRCALYRWLLLAAAATCSLGAARADAQDLEAACAGDLLTFPLPPFEAFDANDDNLLDQREVAGCETLSAMFTELDIDASEALTRPEYASYVALWSQRARSFRDDQEPLE